MRAGPALPLRLAPLPNISSSLSSDSDSLMSSLSATALARRVFWTLPVPLPALFSCTPRDECWPGKQVLKLCNALRYASLSPSSCPVHPKAFRPACRSEVSSNEEL